MPSTKRIGMIVLGLIATPSMAQAAIFGAAGNDRCGIGTKIWGGGQSVSSQSMEESTNVSSGETFSVTSSTSGCKAKGFTQATQEQMLYAAANYEELRMEMAAGRGEILAGFAETLGCSGNAVDRFSIWCKDRFNELDATELGSPENLLADVITRMQTDPAMRTACGGRS